MSDLEEIHDAVSCLQRLTEVFQARRQALAASVGLSEHQWSVLEEIATEHFMPSLFARQSDRSATAISKLLRQLLDKKFIVVSLRTEDGRQRKYKLSDTGTRVLTDLRARRQRAIQEVWQRLDRNKLREFTKFGVQLTRQLEDYALSESESPLGLGRPTRNSADLAPERIETSNGKNTLRQGV